MAMHLKLASFSALVLLVLTGTSHFYVSGSVLFVLIRGPSKVTTGETAQFECSARCDPQCNYVWSVGGKTVHGGVLELTLGASVSTLLLQCTAFNTGTNESSTTTERVTVTNPYSVQPLKDREPKLNEPYSLMCTGPRKLPTVLWYKDGEALAFDPRMSLSEDNSTLSFSSLLSSDGGHYQCNIPTGNIIIESIEYFLTYVPLDVRISGPDTAEVRKEHVFECITNCSDSCSIHWTFNQGFPSGSLAIRQGVMRWTPDRPNIVQNLSCVASIPLAQRSATASKSVRVTATAPTSTKGPDSGCEMLKPNIILGVALIVVLLFRFNS
ncbi:carcinoembryonic antigen-related cell adhesion molecule 5-like [Scleropages formosus]|uniref:carcinoembryonic antigen-related cell adhesion molecule 5-like n=1 Tax=Scleropages formosus TaxID=113540 RepID=UPI00087813D9|nr:carcinoembryonic antigen-related cell adhesion molecule 5-like [Scleropages formosus]